MLFWIDTQGLCHSQDCTVDGIELALKRANELRAKGFKHVCLSTENENCVTKKGVDSVEEGKTPDGHCYDWSKKQRGHPGLK